MRALTDEKILDLIGSFYAMSESTTQSGWSEVFSDLSRCFSSGTGSLSFYSPHDRRFEMFVGTIEPEFLAEYNSYYHTVSPVKNQLLKLKAGGRLNRAEHCPDDQFEKTEIYQKHFKRQDVFHYEHRVLFQDDDKKAGITFSRPRRMENFGEPEQRLLNLLVPHLQKSLQMFLRFVDTKRDNLILTECLERVSESVIVVDAFGKVRFLNELARRLIDNKSGLMLDNAGCLVSTDSNETKDLRLLLKGVFEPSITDKKSFGGYVSIARAGGKRPLSVFVTPFSDHQQNFLNATKLAILFVNDPEREIEEIEPVLSRVYRLTPAESRIAAHIARGRTLREVGELLGVSQNTIRTHLKRVFSKTETNRQSELVKLVLNNICSGGKRAD